MWDSGATVMMFAIPLPIKPTNASLVVRFLEAPGIQQSYSPGELSYPCGLGSALMNHSRKIICVHTGFQLPNLRLSYYDSRIIASQYATTIIILSICSDEDIGHIIGYSQNSKIRVYVFTKEIAQTKCCYLIVIFNLICRSCFQKNHVCTKVPFCLMFYVSCFTKFILYYYSISAMY